LRDGLDPDGPCIRALELFCLRAGIRVLSLSARVLNGIGDVALVHRPDLVLLAGAEFNDASVARWARVIGRSVGPLPFALYRPSSTRVSGIVFPPGPAEAQLRVRELADRAVPAAVVSLARAG
jgi:hypothetical protein